VSRGNTKTNNYWLVSAARGGVSLLAGLILAFINTRRTGTLTTAVAVSLSAIFIIDIIDIIIRRKTGKNNLIPAINAAMELIVINLLFASLFKNLTDALSFGLRINILAIYAIIYSILAIVRGFRNHKVGMDRFMLVTQGLIGTAAGFIMLIGHFYEMTYILLFGLFLMVNGLTALVFAFSSKNLKKGEK
jgi:uncharacterized membrane protein HdeD (DUF308 family)